MQLLDKFSSMKSKIDELESKTINFEKETNSKLNSIKSTISIIESIAAKIDKFSVETENKLKNFEDRYKSMELQLERKVDKFESQTDKFDKWIKDLEDKNTKDEKKRDKAISDLIETVAKETEENKKKIKELSFELKDKHDKLETWIVKTDKQNSSLFEGKTKQITDVQKSLDELRRNFDDKQKELQKTLLVTATDQDIKDLKEDIGGIKEKMKKLVQKDDVAEIKRATVGIDKIVADSLSDIRNEFDEIKKKMTHFAEFEKIRQSFAEMKVDVASTEAGLQRTVEELSQKIDMMKESVGTSAEFKQLADQDFALRTKIEDVDSKVSQGLDKVLTGFESLGEIFANKQELNMNLSEMTNELKNLQQAVQKVDRRHLDLEKQIILREDLKDKATQESAQEALSKVYDMINEFNQQKGVSMEILEEFKILKEQIITTQNAIVELNQFVQRTASPGAY